MTNYIQQAWDDGSDAYFDRVHKNGDVAHLKDDPWWAFPTPVRAMLRAGCGALEGARVLVPSSGDNGAAFAFHLLGARVTSTDISPRQLHNARAIADAQGWNIEFACADSMTLEGIPDGAFDMVYTSNGVHVWIDDLNALYRSFVRVLRPGGRYIMFDTHPFNRPFDDSTVEIRLCKDYDDTAGNHWRVMDIFNALVRQGFDVQRMEEFHAERGAHDLWYYRTLEEWRAHVRPGSQPMGAPAGMDRPVSTEAIITAWPRTHSPRPFIDVIHMEEFHAERGAHDLWFYRTLEEARQDGERMFDPALNAWARLPAWIGLSAQKRL